MTYILFDTSVLIAGFVASHPKHHDASMWLQRAIAKKIKWAVSSHSLAECYAVLTQLPLSPKIIPSVAKLLIDENIINSAKIISLSDSEYSSLINETASLGLIGGIIYDAIIFKAAQKAKVQHILTLNPKDFQRFVHHKNNYILSSL